MLHRFLEAIQAEDMQSLPELARKLDISTAMVLQIAQDLTRTGYLEEIGSDCAGPQPGCPDCAAAASCQIVTRHWFLTAKARSALSAIPSAK